MTTQVMFVAVGPCLGEFYGMASGMEQLKEGLCCSAGVRVMVGVCPCVLFPCTGPLTWGLHEKPGVLEDLGAQQGIASAAKQGQNPSFYRLGVLFYHLHYPYPS